MKSVLYIIVSIGILVMSNSCKEELPLSSEKLFSISGKILDSENNSPIAGAFVTLNEISDSTNIEGNFSINNLESNNYTLSITHPNYENYSEEIFISKDSTVNITLSIIYNDYLQLDSFPNKYNYSYNYSHGAPRPSYIKKQSISTWTIKDTVLRNDTTVYIILETRIDSVERYVSFGGTFNYQDTISQYFEIVENVDHIISSLKFPQDVIFPRYIRVDEVENQYFSSSNGFVELKKNVGIIHLSTGWSQGADSETINYNRIE